MTAPTPDPGALLDRLEEARKAATPGPWKQDGTMIAESRHLNTIVDCWEDPADAALIVAAVNALPDLIRLARDGLALRAGVERLAERLDTLSDPYSGRAANRLRAVVADTSGEWQ